MNFCSSIQQSADTFLAALSKNKEIRKQKHIFEILVQYQGVAPGFSGWNIATHKKLLKIQNGDIFEQ